MHPDLAARLRRIMRRETTAESGVTGVAGVVFVADNVSKILKLQRQRRQRHGSSGAGEGVFSGVVEGVVGLPEPGPIELEERKGMAMDSVPVPYLESPDAVTVISIVSSFAGVIYCSAIILGGRGRAII